MCADIGFSSRHFSHDFTVPEKSRSRDRRGIASFLNGNGEVFAVMAGEPSVARSYPRRPIPAVGAVIVKGKDVLLVMRGKEPGYGQWSIPGGAIQVGETMEQAVVREIREEVGVTIDSITLVETLDRIIPDEKGLILYHYVLLDFLCLYRSGELRPGSDVIEVRWVKEGDLGRYALPKETEEVIRKGLEMAKTCIHHRDTAGTETSFSRLPGDPDE